MQNSSNQSSTFNSEDYKQWLSTLERYSKKYQKFGSLLPAQLQLLEQIFENLILNKYKVVSFTAPPASGKTHVIALCAAYLSVKGFATCIVTPNGELKSDFTKEMQDVNTGTRSSIPIESINSYRKKRSNFDFVLVDEAHNLRSSIEIDDSIVKSFHFEEGDELFECASSGIDQSKYVTKELSIETSSDILKKMNNYPEFKKDVHYLLRGLTKWRAFYTGFQKSCDLKFLLADPSARSILPRGRLFLFSATRLDENELSFYCNIPSDILCTVGEKKTSFSPKKNIKYYCLPLESDVDKISATCALLNKKRIRSLILLNNNSKCILWKNELNSIISDRLIVVQSGLNYSERAKAFNLFEKDEAKILITSSNVYWEGITVKNLKLLIIPYNPFPQPTLLELAERKTTEYQAIADKRLIQGLGRIGRQQQDTGLCLLLFRPSRSFQYIQHASLDAILASINDGI